MSCHFRRIANAAGLAAAFTLACVSFAHSAPIDPYIPKSGVMDARLMVIVAAQEAEQISQKMLAAVAKDPSWLVVYAKKHEKDVGALPYDSRIGITENEYDHMIHAKLQLKEIGQMKITVKPDAKGAKVLEVPTNAKALSGIAIAADGKSALTPAGVLPVAADIHNNEPDTPTGPWNGISFGTAGYPQHGRPAVMLAFGKREKERDGIMYYRQSANSQGPTREIVLLYTLN